MRRRSARTAGGRGRVWAGLGVTLGVGLCAALILVPAPRGQARAAKHKHVPRRSVPAAIAVVADPSQPGAPVAKDFLGLSFEVSNLAQIAAYAETGNLVRMLRSLGPGQLRFGGGSADTRVAWTDHLTPRPAWASSVIDVDDLRQLGKLAANSGWQIVLTIGLGHYEPVAAAREAAAAKATLGEHLEGIELGNEPNAFAQHGLRPEPWGFAQYTEEVTAYRAAIEAAAPGIPLIGPDVSGSAAFESWGLEEAVDQRPVELTGHHYPLGCEQKPPPSITRLLSPLIRSRELGSLRRYMAIAQSSRIPFRLDETNSVSCGGTAGISNTFASALWATGYLTRVMSIGVAGVNLHGNPANCNGYAPVCAPGRRRAGKRHAERAARLVRAAALQPTDRRPPAADDHRLSWHAQPPGHGIPRGQRGASLRDRRRRSAGQGRRLAAPEGGERLSGCGHPAAHGAVAHVPVGDHAGGPGSGAGWLVE